MTNPVLLRNQIEQQFKWNAEFVFPTPADWEKEAVSVGGEIEAFAKRQGTLASGATELASTLETSYELIRRVSVLYMYAGMSHSVETTDMAAAAMEGRAGALFGKLAGTVSFVEPELLTIGLEKLLEWVGSESHLSTYEHYFRNLFRQQAHVRSAEVEEVLGMSGEALGATYNVYGFLTDTEIKYGSGKNSKGESFEINQASVSAAVLSEDREVRRTAWEGFMDGHLTFKNTLSSNLMGAINRDVFYARARRYDSSLEAALFPNNIPVEVFTNLIDTFKKNLPTWHKYWRIKRKALGVETLQPYDVWAPLTSTKQKITYPQAVDLISESLRPLGSEYVDTLRRGCLQDRWVDVYPNQDKRQGAFSTGEHGTHPFIMMSFNDLMESMSTLAHELGHSMHSYLTWHNQPQVYSGYSLFVAEVASNFNQAMMRGHLLKTSTDRDFQISVLEEAICNNLHRYFFIMPTLARWELEMHQRAEKGVGVTADDMIEAMAEYFGEGYGGEMGPMTGIDRQRTGITWATFGHLYANYYVFQYATGISAAHALSARILNGVPNAAEDYLSFLKAGSSKYPLDVLKQAGVDLTTPEPVEKTFAILADYVDRLEALIG